MPYVLFLALAQALLAGGWYYLLQGGLWGGYFDGLPAIPFFFTLLPLLAHRYQQRLLARPAPGTHESSTLPPSTRAGGTRTIMLLILLRLLAALVFTLVGVLFLPPIHRLAFIAITATAYLIAFLFTTIMAVRG
ncbi:MAG: hypothetical protein CSA97_03615 [Bacteroidetes bacterium]|nr:MAG: hypothetical protein CSA97_03615 [Bacteroidota bacterium]